MRRVNGIAGAMWAADILLGNKPIPSNKRTARQSGEDFKRVLDEAQRKLEAKGGESMSSKRKMQRQIAHAQAARLSGSGKNGKSSKIFKTIWRGQQAAAGKARQRAREQKTDKDIARLLEKARQQAAERTRE